MPSAWPFTSLFSRLACGRSNSYLLINSAHHPVSLRCSAGSMSGLTTKQCFVARTDAARLPKPIGCNGALRGRVTAAMATPSLPSLLVRPPLLPHLSPKHPQSDMRRMQGTGRRSAAAAAASGSSGDGQLVDAAQQDLQPASLSPAAGPSSKSDDSSSAGADEERGEKQRRQQRQQSRLDRDFDQRLAQLSAWKQQYYDCLVPRKVHDAPGLGEWVHALRRARKLGQLSPEQIAALDALGFLWQVDVITAKWYSNLHAARQYLEMQGELPAPDLHMPKAPDWVEAGRWLARQQELYKGQKLLPVRVRLLKEVLGAKLERPRAPTRRNLHPVLKKGRETFRAEAAARAAAQGAPAAVAGNAVGQQDRRRQRQQ